MRTVTLVIHFQSGQQTLENPEKPWIFFAPVKIPWKTLKLKHAPEKLCFEADFLCTNIWPYSTAAFLILGRQSRPLLTSVDSDGTIDRHTGGCRGCNTLNAFLPSVNSAILLYESRNSAIVSAH